MKVSSFCAPCKAKRFYEAICLSTKDEKLRKKTIAAVLAGIKKAIEANDCPSFAGTVQSEIVMRITKNTDPYAKKKNEAIRRAKRIFPEFDRWVLSKKTNYARFVRALKLAIAGNALEISAQNYSVDLKGLNGELKTLLGKRLAIDDARKIFSKVRKAKDVLYLCDNCGEAVFDIPLIREISRYAQVTIAVCSEPMDEDVSLKEAKAIGLNRLASVIGKGRSYGVWKERAPKGFWGRLERTDLIIAKGMANYETIDEYKNMAKGRTALLFLVKCPAVGESIRLPKGALVARML